MIIAILVITISWLLNAMMDAIDHGKGGETLKNLWHILKWFSYAIPFGYIFWTAKIPLIVICIIVFVLWVAWESLYAYLRSINFYKYDSF